MEHLKIFPMKGVVGFSKQGKLSPLHVGPYIILQKYSKVDNELRLLRELALVHQAFHVSMLKKYISDPQFILPIKSLGEG